MEDSRNIIKAIDALTLKAGGEVVDSKNITEAIDRLKAVYDQEAIGIDDTLTQEGLAADAKAVGKIAARMGEKRLNKESSVTIRFWSYSGGAIIFGAISNSEPFCYIFSNGYLAPITSPSQNIEVTLSSDYMTVTVVNKSSTTNGYINVISPILGFTMTNV